MARTQKLRIVAIICARDEEAHIGPALRDFISQGVEVVLIDHGSTDLTRDRAEVFLGRGLLSIEALEWSGSFSLSAQLRAKQRVIDRLDADWLIHADADEWFQAPACFANLHEAIEVADLDGYNCVNFDELTFVPLADEDFEKVPYRQRMLRYYFFEPRPQRLMRAWSRKSGLGHGEGDGHQVHGANVKVFPENFLLRHYIALSPAHAARKYLGRSFADEDLAKGWHGNRQDIALESLRLDDSRQLKCLDRSESRRFDKSEPLARHFWEWPWTNRNHLQHARK